MAYFAIALPLADLVPQVHPLPYFRAIGQAGLFFVGPALFGLLLGLNAQSGLMRKLLKKVGIRPLHVMPTAWDWKFSSMTEQLVLVTLKDETKFCGYCGEMSFMSSDPTERDFYIEHVYDYDGDGPWKPRRSSVLIAGGEIRTIEFFPCTQNKECNDAKQD